MPVRCPKCGAEVEDTWPVCRKCFEPVRREGFFSRLLRGLGVRVNVSVSKSSSPIPGWTAQIANFKTETFKIRDASTGEMREYRSLDEVPEELRETIRQAQEAALSGKNSIKIMWTDSAGTVHRYNSVEEMPPEIRTIYEKMRGS